MAKNKTNSKGPVEPDWIVVLPGDNVTKHMRTSSASSDNNEATTSTTTKKVVPKLGPGLRCDKVSDQVFATVAGRLIKRQRGSGNVYFVQQNTERYRPVLQDRVIGIVEDRMGNDGAGGDVYRVNIGASHPAVLSSLAFEGATKRNKPSFSAGQLLYARVADAVPAGGLLDPVLSCTLGPHDEGIPRKDFMTNEGCYGELKGGTVCRIPTGLARELLHPNNLVLAELVKGVAAFEIAVGVNGYLWIHSRLPEYTIMIQNAIQNSEVMTENQVRAMVKSLVTTVEKQLQQDRDSAGD
jgi:exosome complex component RRP40